MEVLNDAPCIVHELPGKYVLVAYFVHSHTGAIETHTAKLIRYTPLPFECLVHSSFYVGSTARDHSDDMSLTGLELLEYLNRPLLDHICSNRPAISERWTRESDCQDVCLHLEDDVEREFK